MMRKVDSTGECWEWLGYVNPAGYGILRLNVSDENVLVYRYLYQALVGSVADGMVLDHKCRNVRCVRPEHLRQVTNKQNTEHFTKMLQSNNTTGYRGVTRTKSGRFMASTKHLGKMHYGGTWATAAEAGESARQLRLSLHTHNELDR